MFKRDNYSKRALSTFEIIGSFIVDLYYNHFYQEAKKIRIDGRVESITDGYKHAVKAYLSSFDRPDSYKKTIIGIHKYYYTTTKFSTISFSECVNEIVKHFIPDDFFESTTNQQRDGILRMVLINSVKRFSGEVLCSNIIDSLIDNHSDTTIVRNMQNKMVEALMFEREKMFQNIFRASNQSSGQPDKDFIIMNKMKDQIVKLVKSNQMLTSKYDSLKNKTAELLELVKGQAHELENIRTKERVDLYNRQPTTYQPPQPVPPPQSLYSAPPKQPQPQTQSVIYQSDQQVPNEEKTLIIPNDNQDNASDPYQVYHDIDYNKPDPPPISELYKSKDESEDHFMAASPDNNNEDDIVVIGPSDNDFFADNMLNIV